MRFGVVRIRQQFLECFRSPRTLISQGCALPASPEGKLLYRPFGCRVYQNAPGKLSKPSPPGKGDRPQAVDEGRYGVSYCRNNGRRGRDVSTNSPTVSRMFQAAPPLISQGCALPASPGGKLLYRALGWRVYRYATGKLSKPSPPGKGDRPQAVDEGRYGVVHCRNNGRRG